MKVGFIGCGHIARTMAETVNNTKGFELYGVAARDLDRATSFKDEFGAKKAYGSYEELVSDDNVELVYIATPHSHHRDHMMLCIEHNKNILCEKAFTVNEAEAVEVLTAAKEKGVFVAEAIWTRYMPARKLINDIVTSGKIGRVTSITANLGYQISNKERIIHPSLGGGALLDIGIYPLNFALMARDGVAVKALTGICTKADTGVDLQDSMTLAFEDGSIATIFADAEVTSDRRGYIYGTKGYIEVENINNPEVIRVFDDSRKPFMNSEIIIKNDYNGYEYELIEAKKCIEEGKIESEMMSHKETLRVMRFMDAFRASWGVKLSNEI